MSKKELSSGHIAGLQSSSSFQERERIARSSRDEGFQDPSLTGENAETVYRDRRGKKLDMLNEFMRQQANKEGQKYKLAQAQFAWGLGTVQKEQHEEKLKSLEEIAAQPFARTIDDPRLEAQKKEEIRDGDPMAAYFLKKKDKHARREEGEAQSEKLASEPLEKKPRKPVYKGPLPPPNRFKILPGYRWDAVDRGNKFEHKLLVKLNEKTVFREDEYKYLSSDL
jgi:pre-mRNA-splicing factor CWC26